VEGQIDGSTVDRRRIADIIEMKFGHQPDADRFADLMVDPETDHVSIGDLVTRLYSLWKKNQPGGGA